MPGIIDGEEHQLYNGIFSLIKIKYSGWNIRWFIFY